MKSIANYISIMRIVLSLTLALTQPLSTIFSILYIICGISDALDGYIARKTNTTSKLGAKLDSIADLVMVVVLVIVLYPLINLKVHIIFWIFIIAIIRIISIILVFIKYRTFQILHTYGNRITGLVLFIFPLSLTFVQLDMMLYIICIIANISAIEELLIHISSAELQANRKNLFLK